MRPRGGLAAVVLLVAVAACSDDDGPSATASPADEAIATFETVDGERYRLVLRGEHLDRARDALASGAAAGIPNGVMRPGDGGVNVGHEWHVVDVELADATPEVCDGTVSYVDDIGYDEFVAMHGERFCPWGATLVSLE